MLLISVLQSAINRQMVSIFHSEMVKILLVQLGMQVLTLILVTNNQEEMILKLLVMCCYIS